MFITVNVRSGSTHVETLINPQAIRSVVGIKDNGAEIVFMDKSIVQVKEEFYVVRAMIQKALGLFNEK